MQTCPQCGKEYPETFRYCPVDGAPLEGAAIDEGPETSSSPRTEKSIPIRVLLASIGILFLLGLIAFAGVFGYFYYKPKYGGLIVKTTPAAATVFIDGKQRGTSPLTVGDLRAGGHQIKAVKEGYKDFVQQLEVLPFSTENLHWILEPLVPHLSNEQLAEIESWRKKLDTSQKENILLPPPDDYNVLYFANKILAIDPANAYSLEAKNKIIEGIRHNADLAYAREDWFEAERHYKTLAQILPNDLSVSERLTDIAAKIDASVKDREKQIADWTAKAEAAIKAGLLVPPDKDNALEAVRTVQRLEKNSAFAREGMVRIKEMLQNRGDTKIGSGDWLGARTEFRLVLQHFPDDNYSKARLPMVEGKLAEATQAEQQRQQRIQEEQQNRQGIANLRQSGINAYRSGAYAKAVADLQEYLKAEPVNEEALFYLGASYVEQKQYDNAILNLEKCLSQNPTNAMAHLNLGILYDQHRGDLTRAVDHLKKVRDLGGVEKYSPERLLAMTQELQQRTQLNAMQKIPFTAEHKHAFSVCRGNLRITGEGIEFHTTETDHSFYEIYSNLRAVSVQGEELSLRTQNNKKYNFRLPNSGDGEKVRRLIARHISITG